MSQLLLLCALAVLHLGPVGGGVRTGGLRQGQELSRQMDRLRAATTTRIDQASPTSVTAIRGETAMLVCRVTNIGDKSVSWVRHSVPLPQLVGLNNVTVSLNPRYRAIVSSSWTEFVLVVKDVRPRDSGTYECQVSGPKHSSLSRRISLHVIESMTEIVGGPDIYVDRLSRLQLTCRVTSGDNNPAFIIWQKENKILKFDGGETSAVPYLERDGQGRHLSSLRVDDIQLGDSGEYSCQPAVGPQAAVLVHVLNRDTEVQAVLGEGVENTGPAVTLPSLPSQASHLPALRLLVVTTWIIQ